MLREQKRIVEQNDINKDFAKIYFIYESDGEDVCKQIQFDEYGDFVDSPKEFTTFFSDGFKDAMEIAALKAKKYQEKKMDTVIDTNILVHSNDLKSDYEFDCLLFLTNFMQREDNMAVDYKGEMLAEYEDNLSGETFPRMFLSEMRRQKRLVYRDSKISNRIDNKIYDQICFARHMPPEGKHSKEARALAREIVARLEVIPTPEEFDLYTRLWKE